MGFISALRRPPNLKRLEIDLERAGRVFLRPSHQRTYIQKPFFATGLVLVREHPADLPQGNLLDDVAVRIQHEPVHPEALTVLVALARDFDSDSAHLSGFGLVFRESQGRDAPVRKAVGAYGAQLRAPNVVLDARLDPFLGRGDVGRRAALRYEEQTSLVVPLFPVSPKGDAG